MQKVNLELCSYPEYLSSDPPENMEATLSGATLEVINKAKQLLKDNPSFTSICVHPTPNLTEEDDEALDEALRCDVSHIVVYPHGGLYWYMQGKYDCNLQIEYSITFKE